MGVVQPLDVLDVQGPLRLSNASTERVGLGLAAGYDYGNQKISKTLTLLYVFGTQEPRYSTFLSA